MWWPHYSRPTLSEAETSEAVSLLTIKSTEIKCKKLFVGNVSIKFNDFVAAEIALELESAAYSTNTTAGEEVIAASSASSVGFVGSTDTRAVGSIHTTITSSIVIATNGSA